MEEITEISGLDLLSAEVDHSKEEAYRAEQPPYGVFVRASGGYDCTHSRESNRKQDVF